MTAGQITQADLQMALERVRRRGGLMRREPRDGTAPRPRAPTRSGHRLLATLLACLGPSR